MGNCIRTLGIVNLVHSDIGKFIVNKTADQYYIQVFLHFFELT